ncbi:hypothetical protein MAHJHV65_44620 [Mycobacterium avium subsp. hominissuis]
MCLYETVSRAPGGQRGADSLVPERLGPTIAQWMSLYTEVARPRSRIFSR